MSASELTDSRSSEHQDKRLYVRLEKVKTCLLIASAASGLLYVWLRRQDPLLTAVCLLIPLICIVLDIRFGAYVTLAFPKEELDGSRGLRISLLMPFALSLACLAAATVLNLHFSSFWMLFASGVLFGAAAWGILVLLVPEFRSKLTSSLAALLILALMGFGVTGQANYWLDTSEPEIVTGQVVNLHDELYDPGDSGKYSSDLLEELTRTRFVCTVLLPDGTEAEFFLPALGDTLINDRVALDRMDGFLGLECYCLRTDKPNIRK